MKGGVIHMIDNEKLSNFIDDNLTTDSPYGVYSFEYIFSFKHLCESANLCKRNVYWKASVQNFMRATTYNCRVIHRHLMDGTFKFMKTNKFDIFERGKLRHIKSVKIRDRVVQKALCNYCLLPLFQPSFIYDNCASTKNKGISFAFRRVAAMLQKHYRRYGNEGYVLTFDFKDYFGSINHEKALEMVAKKVKDEQVLEIVKAAISIYSENGGVGIGLGSELSQFLALLFANPIDHLIKDKLKFKYYIRYMDDGFIISDSKERLQEALIEIQEMCKELDLKLNMNKTHIVPLKQGFRFLKKRILLGETGRITMKISRSTVTRMRRKLKKFAKMFKNGEMTIKHIEEAYVSWRGFVKQFDAFETIKKMDELYDSLFGYIPHSKQELAKIGERAAEKKTEVLCEMAQAFFGDFTPYAFDGMEEF